jgi:parallel beta-helix repeat protein
LNISGNSLRTSSGIFFVNVTNSKIVGNQIDHPLYNGIDLEGGNSNVTLQNNILIQPGTQGYNGIFLTDVYSETPNTNVNIVGNVILNAGLSGIVIRNSNNNTVKSNIVIGSKGFDLSDPTWGSGISLENAQNNTITLNQVRTNRANGIRVDVNSAGNTISNNTSIGNGNVNNSPPTYDYYDESSGSGTAGTANTYTGNKGRTQNRTGLIQIFV